MADMQWVMGSVRDDGACIEDGEGRNTVWVERITGDGINYRTTDGQWQSIVDCIAAAPEMLAACKEMVRAFEKGDNVDELVALRSIKDALAKAEPPRRVKKRMLVTVEVEVEADSTTPLDAIKNRAFDSVFTGCGAGVEFKGKTVTSVGELYED